jgi:acyl carrier protein
LRAFLKETLPEYAIPAAFVSLEKLPLTPAGKVDRRALPAPDTTRQEIDEEFMEPESPIEMTLADIWRELIPVKKISIYDNFFTLGGHSLLATQLVSRIHRSFEVDIALRTIFESPTLAELAIKVEEAILIQIENIDEDDLPEDWQD